MKLLLDTSAFLWFQADSPHLSPVVRAQILDPANEVYLSSMSVWEIARKYGQGGIALPSHPSARIPVVREEPSIASLSLAQTDALTAEKLQLLHKGPFDRMLIAQALLRGLVIAACDRAFEPYPVQVLW
ncbi:MAG: type II toxin-antitoxin system VapC family toxin [Bryobacteraceae bacterium]|nr:type II toxin-antitoxin system VapC family toxin [Bryobacteraceae bacterium]